MQRNIKVLVVEPEQLPRIEVIPNTLTAKQKVVGGLIEYAYIDDNYDAAIICNEEGKFIGLSPNRLVGDDVIFGTFLIVGDNEDGEDHSLGDEQIEKYQKRFDKKSIVETNEYMNELLLKIKMKGKVM